MSELNIYFGASIRGGRDENDIRRYQTILEILKRRGRVFTEHVGSDLIGSQGEQLSAEYIHQRDMRWLKLSHVMVAEISRPSLGVGYECCYAEHVLEIPILGLYHYSERERISPMIYGSHSRHLRLASYETEWGLKLAIDDFFEKFAIEFLNPLPS